MSALRLCIYIQLILPDYMLIYKSSVSKVLIDFGCLGLVLAG